MLPARMQWKLRATRTSTIEVLTPAMAAAILCGRVLVWDRITGEMPEWLKGLPC